MSDNMRWKYGRINVVVAAVAAATVIEIGDLLWQDGDEAKPALDQADLGNKIANQERFAENFLGVAMQWSRQGDTDPIRVATTGVFDFDCVKETFRLGDFVGWDENIHSNVSLNQQVSKVFYSDCAIGRVAKREPSPACRVLVDIRSTVMTGGVDVRNKQ